MRTSISHTENYPIEPGSKFPTTNSSVSKSEHLKILLQILKHYFQVIGDSSQKT